MGIAKQISLTTSVAKYNGVMRLIEDAMESVGQGNAEDAERAWREAFDLRRMMDPADQSSTLLALLDRMLDRMDKAFKGMGGGGSKA